jgi:arylsulfatase A-like enzyme
MSRPNILYLHSHDTGRYIQPYGFAVPTPNLQRLAEQGALFRQAFCGNPTCSASRAVLLTGQSAHANGMIGLAHRGFRLNDPRHLLPHTLRAAGFHTALAGVQHVASHVDMPDDLPGRIGYDERLQREGRTTEQVVDDFLRRPPRQPFFLDVGFVETHRVFPDPALADDPRYLRPPLPLPDTAETRRDMAAYHTLARRLDARMGAVLASLDARGLAGNTLVICTTDHGIAFPAMKCNLTDHGLGVMLILRGPDGAAAGGADPAWRALRGGAVCDELVSHVDVFPTLCDLLGLTPPPWLEGRSLGPWLRGETSSHRDEVFGEVNVHVNVEPQRTVRTKRWRYIRRYGRRPRPDLPNCDASPSKDLWMAAGWGDRPLPAETLHDLVFDPCEAANAAGDPANRGVLEDLRGRLDRWMRETGDPLCEGRLRIPAGARLGKPGARHVEQGDVVLDRAMTWPDDFEDA